ncbi:hypothetical protein [Alkalihalobacillus pseudalcaliphilus]|uniref:hypothetical protein n=1 Tax=Alkalihalobacillus pseudalcaliphilus TaxID=79884 RepID=UPI00064D8486|nr:hypothetical protein [Alkalihalobacillus pseudalcaliphilus]KMK75439.1 hypothetical protein AB990_08995 [Alkalihalobacillus pseudalcaliphilus]
MNKNNEFYRHAVRAAKKRFKADAVDYIRSQYGMCVQVCVECFVEDNPDREYLNGRVLALTRHLDEALAYIDKQFAERE